MANEVSESICPGPGKVTIAVHQENADNPCDPFTMSTPSTFAVAFFIVLLVCVFSLRADPLLRRDWIPDERDRSRGMFHRVSQAVESPESKFPLRDLADRPFRLTLGGELSITDSDIHWKPIVVNSDNVPFHMAEAESLVQHGLPGEAVLLWKGIVAMRTFLVDPPAHVRAGAKTAAHRLNEFRRRPAFREWDEASDPFVFADGERSTIVWSDRFAFRIVLPGRWEWLPPKRPVSDRGVERALLHLRRGGLLAAIGADSWALPRRMGFLDDFVSLWDIRRSVGAQRRQVLGFQRSIHPLSATVCPNACRLFSVFTATDSHWFTEYFRMDNDGGLLVMLQNADGSPVPDEIIRDIRFAETPR